MPIQLQLEEPLAALPLELGGGPWGAAAGVSGAFGLGSFYLALSRGTMGLVAPLGALLAAAWPATFALRVAPLEWIGGALALAGLALAVLGEGRYSVSRSSPVE